MPDKPDYDIDKVRTEHPTPWRIGSDCIEDANGRIIYYLENQPECIDTDEHTVHCVNMHDELVEENKQLRESLAGSNGILKMALGGELDQDGTVETQLSDNCILLDRAKGGA